MPLVITNGNGDVMTKKLLSVFIAVGLMLQCSFVFAQGEYYNYRDLQSVGSDVLAYSRSNIDFLEQIVSDAKKTVQYKAQRNKVTALANKCISLYSEICNSHAVATVNYDCKNNNDNAEKLNVASRDAVRASTLLNEFVYTVYNSEYSYIIPEVFGEVEAGIYIGSSDDEVSVLFDKEQELTNKYNEIYGDSEQCAALFLELVEVRNNLARKAGYNNYAEYANYAIYGRQFTDEEISRFYSGVKGHLIPIYYEVLSALEVMEPTDMPMSEDDVLLKTRSVMGNINTQNRTCF